MLAIVFCIALFVTPFCLIIKAIVSKNGSAPPKPPTARRTDPIDRHMDENYADIDWLRNGKL